MTDVTKAEVPEYCDYEGSVFRSILTWTLYPLGVLVPLVIAMWALENGRPGMVGMIIGVGFMIPALMEFIHPHTLRWRRWGRDLITDLLHLGITMQLAVYLVKLLMASVFVVSAMGAGQLSPFEWPTHWPLALQFLLALFIAEFIGYWQHRIFHEWPLAWRFHAVHHSARRLYWMNAPRFHLVNIFVGNLLKGLWLGLFAPGAEVLVLVGLFGALHGNWQHGNIRHKLGWFNWILASAELHRWHHSSDVKYANSNYGSNLILWDIVFGTRKLPVQQQRAAEIGLGDHDVTFPENWFKQWLVPFFWKSWVEEPARRCAEQRVSGEEAASEVSDTGR